MADINRGERRSILLQSCWTTAVSNGTAIKGHLLDVDVHKKQITYTIAVNHKSPAELCKGWELLNSWELLELLT